MWPDQSSPRVCFILSSVTIDSKSWVIVCLTSLGCHYCNVRDLAHEVFIDSAASAHLHWGCQVDQSGHHQPWLLDECVMADGDAAPVTLRHTASHCVTLRHTASQPGTGQWNILTFAASGDTAVVIRAQEDAVHVLLSSVATHLVHGTVIFLARQAILWYGTKCSTFPVLSYWA